MKRTAEKSLAITSMVLSIIGIIMGAIVALFFNQVKSDSQLMSDFEQSVLSDPAFTEGDLDLVHMIFDFFGGTMWFVIVALIISVIMTIIGLVNISNSKNPKLAGIMFLIAGVLAGFISLPSILLYIAGILCLVRKPPLTDKEQFADNSYDGTMRPL